MTLSQVSSVDRLIDEYLEDATIIKAGQQMNVPALSELEKIEFPRPFGTMEAFVTAGNTTALSKAYKGKIQYLDYKTIRYPGHCQQIKLLRELDLMSSRPLKLASGKVVPRELLTHLLSEKLSKNEPDAVLLRLIVTGVKDGKPTQVVWECVDYANQADGLSAMMRMTAFPRLNYCSVDCKRGHQPTRCLDCKRMCTSQIILS